MASRWAAARWLLLHSSFYIFFASASRASRVAVEESDAIAPNVAADKIAVRICMGRMAVRFHEAFADAYREYVSEEVVSPRYTNYTLPELVTAYEGVRDQLSPQGWIKRRVQGYGLLLNDATAALKGDEKILLKQIELWIFSPKNAKEACKKLVQRSKKYVESKEKCAEPIGFNEAARKVIQNSVHVKQLLHLQDVTVTQRRLHPDRSSLRKYMESYFETTQGRARELELDARSAGVDKIDFDLLVKCRYMESASVDLSLSSLTRLIEREVNAPAIVDDNKCIEDTRVGYCGEGLSPKFQRAITPARGATWGTAAFILGGPVAAGVGSIVGGIAGIPGGPVGIAAGAAAGVGSAAAVPLGVIAAPLAVMAGSRDIFASCRCYENKCFLNARTQVCELQDSALAGNPYQWLPYPGQKCILYEGSCTVQLCSKEDYWSSDDSDFLKKEIFGKIGRKDTNLYNCLSVGAKDPKPLIESNVLPDGVTENTPENRAQFYESLGVHADVFDFIRHSRELEGAARQRRPAR
eukprot:TRINITY_DN71651_c0_g1_i1.p1 TRINITY_DN71651_c0_g1~~TRINITY_DN71651_c0_g1_i1.p1  ORF type:complete len:545 (-),score=76.38 TRINITY_DN71651_c0_g1_i1:105-1676(-)